MRHALRVCILLAVTVAAGFALAACDLLAPHGDFDITVKQMSASNPLYAQSAEKLAYVVNRVEGDTITLTAAHTTYTFGVNAPGHPFYISTISVQGGIGFPGKDTADFTGPDQAEFGLLTFTAPSGPTTLYYDCGVHEYMGGTINIP